MSPAEALLAAFTMQNFTAVEVRTGIAWSGTLYRDGRPALRVEQDGRGGCNRYTAPGGGRADALVEELSAAGVALGLDRYEPLDAITSGMVAGGTALDGARAALEFDREID